MRKRRVACFCRFWSQYRSDSAAQYSSGTGIQQTPSESPSASMHQYSASGYRGLHRAWTCVLQTCTFWTGHASSASLISFLKFWSCMFVVSWRQFPAHLEALHLRHKANTSCHLQWIPPTHCLMCAPTTHCRLDLFQHSALCPNCH